MGKFVKSFRQGESLTHWQLTDLEEKEFRAAPKPMKEEMCANFFKNGIISQQYPCRVEFLQQVKTRTVQKEDSPHYSEIYFPFENEKIERSGFWFFPTYVTTTARTFIHSETEQDVDFILATCGGAFLWLNGKAVGEYCSYQRNVEKQWPLTLSLEKGDNELIILFDDLCERDARYYFLLTLESQKTLSCFLPISENPNHVQEIETWVQGIHFKTDRFSHGSPHLYFSGKLQYPVQVSITVEGNFIESCKPKRYEFDLSPEITSLSLPEVTELPVGFCYINCAFQIGTITINRTLPAEFMDIKRQPIPLETVLERKQQALTFSAHYGIENTARALAIFAAQEKTLFPQATQLIEKAMAFINKRGDCADFSIIPLLWIWKYYPENITDERQELKETLLNFRYWMDEPGNDVMWYFSENHALLFHCCQMIAGEFLPDDIFTNSGMTGKEASKVAYDKMTAWFEHFFQCELSEWNSIPYFPIDMMGFLTIIEFSSHETLKKHAKKALNILFEKMALHHHHGYMGASQGRSYEKNLKGVRSNEMSAFFWVFYKTGNLNEACWALPLLSLSNYTPDKTLDVYLTPKKEDALIVTQSQGENNFVSLSLYKTHYYLMESAQEYNPYGHGYQETILYTVLGEKNTLHLWLNHPGESIPIGFGRPGFWAGNGSLPSVFQYKNIAMALYDIPQSETVNYTHFYFPIESFEAILKKNQRICASFQNAYIGIFAQEGLSLSETGLNRGRELISKGRKNAWLIKTGSVDEFENFENFCRLFTTMPIHFESQNAMLSTVDPQWGELSSQERNIYQKEAFSLKPDIKIADIQKINRN